MPGSDFHMTLRLRATGLGGCYEIPGIDVVTVFWYGATSGCTLSGGRMSRPAGSRSPSANCLVRSVLSAEIKPISVVHGSRTALSALRLRLGALLCCALRMCHVWRHCFRGNAQVATEIIVSGGRRPASRAVSAFLQARARSTVCSMWCVRVCERGKRARARDPVLQPHKLPDHLVNCAAHRLTLSCAVCAAAEFRPGGGRAEEGLRIQAVARHVTGT